jgi:hypothetical protein
MRSSDYIDRRQFTRLKQSVHFAGEIGRPLNAFVTLQFGATSCDADRVGPAFRDLLKNYFGPWLRPTRRGAPSFKPAVYIYAVENKRTDDHPHGTHVHWMVHVPPERRAAFEAKLPHWLAKVAGPIHNLDAAIDVQDTDDTRKRALYLGKALHPSLAKKHGVKFTSPQGQVFGRRCSIAESINAAAIMRHRERLALSTPTIVDDIPTVVMPWPANDIDDDASAAVPW